MDTIVILNNNSKTRGTDTFIRINDWFQMSRIDSTAACRLLHINLGTLYTRGQGTIRRIVCLLRQRRQKTGYDKATHTRTYTHAHTHTHRERRLLLLLLRNKPVFAVTLRNMLQYNMNGSKPTFTSSSVTVANTSRVRSLLCCSLSGVLSFYMCIHIALVKHISLYICFTG